MYDIVPNENLIKIGNFFFTIGLIQWLSNTFINLKSNNISELITLYIAKIQQATIKRLLNYTQQNNIMFTFSLALLFCTIILHLSKNICSVAHFKHIIYYTSYYNFYEPYINDFTYLMNVIYGFKMRFDGHVLSLLFLNK